MRMVICKDCKKRYDYEQDNFCPRCGAFYAPVRQQGVVNSGVPSAQRERKSRSLVRYSVMDYLDNTLSLVIGLAAIAVIYVLLERGVVLFVEMYGGL